MITADLSASTSTGNFNNSSYWTTSTVLELFDLRLFDLLFKAYKVLCDNFDPSLIQLSTLISIKTGNCSEDCGYCSQSKRYKTNIDKSELLSTEEVIKSAVIAKNNGAGRFCMGAAWRGVKNKDIRNLTEMIRAVKSLGLETCVTLGLLKYDQAVQLKESGLDYYNHNLDTDPNYYDNIVTTHNYKDRIDTIKNVRKAGIKVCSGGILGMGETREHRAGFIAALANLDPPPESVPINNLVPIPGTPLALSDNSIDIFEFIRTIAVARITMPSSYIRLSAGRSQMNETEQALCFLSGANSIFYGEELLTTNNKTLEEDNILLKKLDLHSI